MIGLFARLSKGGFHTDLPLETEFDFYKLVYQLESSISGVADLLLMCGERVLISRPLNKTPRRVFNHYTQKWDDFEYFRTHSFEYPMQLRFLYATYVQDNSLLQYGFF